MQVSTGVAFVAAAENASYELIAHLAPARETDSQCCPAVLVYLYLQPSYI